MVHYYDRSTDQPATELHDDLVPLRWPYLAVVDIDGKGRGVITTRDLPQGALIERAPVLIIPEHHRPLADKTVVFKYLFMWEYGRRQSDLAHGTGRAAIALGITSLVNHSEYPNAAFRRRIDGQEIELRAIRDIGTSEEIVIDYRVTLSFPAAERAA
jgi:SET domain-containing protein